MEDDTVVNQNAALLTLSRDTARLITDANEAMDIDTSDVNTANHVTDEGTAGQSQSIPQSSNSAQQSAGSQQLGSDIRSQTATQKLHGRPQAGKPTSIPHAQNFPLRKQVPPALEFQSSATIKAALANAWSRDADVAVQAGVLYELFGDSILPYVPMLPLMSFH